MLETENLSKIYTERKEEIIALDSVSLEVKDGTTALLGPNGSGKSTLIKIILGLTPPTSGKYSLFRDSANTKSSITDRIGYMPETPSLISGVNAVKFIRHMGMLSGLSRTRAMQRAHEVLDYVGITEARYRTINSYSTGMKQRILFAQALVNDPEFIILDEPTTGLSPEGRESMLFLIKEISQKYGKSIMFSTHILPDVEKICKQLIILNYGKLVYQGDFSEAAKNFRGKYEVILNHYNEKVKQLFSERSIEIQRDIQHSTKLYLNTEQNLTLSDITDIFDNTDFKLLAFRKQQPNFEDIFINLLRQKN